MEQQYNFTIGQLERMLKERKEIVKYRDVEYVQKKVKTIELKETKQRAEINNAYNRRLESIARRLHIFEYNNCIGGLFLKKDHY